MSPLARREPARVNVAQGFALRRQAKGLSYNTDFNSKAVSRPIFANIHRKREKRKPPISLRERDRVREKVQVCKETG